MENDVVTIVWGDSITYGLYDYEYGGWVNRLNIKLMKKSNNYFTINLGIPGEISSDILNRLENELKSRYNEIDHFKLIFAFGINDSRYLNEDDNYIEIFKDNLIKIINIAKEYSDDVTFVGLLLPDFEIRKEFILDNVLIIDDMIKKQCQTHNIKYIDMKNVITSDNYTDGIHPDSVGHEKICNEILKIYDK